jgi:hypothetical protein
LCLAPRGVAESRHAVPRNGRSAAMPDLTIGSRGVLTVATRGADGPGEVHVDDGETFIAYSQEALPKGRLWLFMTYTVGVALTLSR